MKYVFRIILMAILLGYSALSCNKTGDQYPGADTVNYNITKAYNLTDIAYGNDAQQKMDIYLPANRNSASTKVFVMIHGGGWSAGDKADYSAAMASIQSHYPNHAIININYRLGTITSPGYTKQIEDIQSALTEIQKPLYNVSRQYLLYGGSAGAHLSMLYAYAHDPNGYVKGVINTVGPADLTDPAFLSNPLYLNIFSAFIGHAAYNYATNPALFIEVSPARQVTINAPPTLSFYGDADPLIPSSQISLLRTALEEKGIWHYDTLYPGGGHAVWASAAQNEDYINRIVTFINTFFN